MPIVRSLHLSLLPGCDVAKNNKPFTDFESLTDLQYANSADSRIIEIAETKRKITVLADE